MVNQGIVMPFYSPFLEAYEEPAGLPWPHPLASAAGHVGGAASLRTHLQQHPSQVSNTVCVCVGGGVCECVGVCE